jgi:hypothetical protein
MDRSPPSNTVFRNERHLSVIRRATVADAAILGRLLAIAQVTDLRWEPQPPAPLLPRELRRSHEAFAFDRRTLSA